MTWWLSINYGPLRFNQGMGYRKWTIGRVKHIEFRWGTDYYYSRLGVSEALGFYYDRFAHGGLFAERSIRFLRP